MLYNSTRTIVIGLLTGAALIGLAFYERYRGPIHGTEAILCIFAAIIWLSPVVYRLLRCKGCGNKALKVG